MNFFAGSIVLTACTVLQTAAPLPVRSAAPQANSATTPQTSQTDEVTRRADAYYYFSLGHLYEEMYDSPTSQEEYATQAIAAYKKAAELDPRSSVIGERLAEMYAKSRRIRDAVLEAQEILKRDPNNLPARRLLARIYLRTLGDFSGTTSQRDTLTRAVEQYREIVRLDPADSDAALWLARLYRLQNDSPKAEEALRQLLAREPQNEAGVEQLTQLLLDLGRADDAVVLLEQLSAKDPSASVLGSLGRAYAQKLDFPRAETAFRRALEQEPEDPAYLSGLGQALVAQEKYEPALEMYRKLTVVDASEPNHYVRLAQIYRRLKQYDNAEEALLSAKQRAPGSLEILYSEALLYEAEGRFDDAIRVLSDAVSALKSQSRRGGESSRSTLAVLYEQLGRLYRETENYTAATSTLRELQTMGPEEDRRARLLIVDTLRASKQIDEALAEANRAREQYPQDSALRSTYAMLLGDAGRTDEGATLLKGTLRHTAEDREVYLGLAQVYERGRRFPEAVDAVQHALKLTEVAESKETEYFLLGAIYERWKKLDLAEENFKKSLAINPRNGQALNYYGYMLADRGIRLEEAVTMIQRAVDDDPYNGAFLDSLGWAFFKLRRYPEAEPLLMRAVERIASDPTIREHLGDLYQQTGRPALAATEWEKALKLWERSLPTEREPEQIAALEAKLASVKARLAQSGSPQTKPQ